MGLGATGGKHAPEQFRQAVRLGNGYRGGRVSVDGVRADTFQENVRVGLTLSFPVTRHSSVKINGSTGAYARFGGSFTTAGIAWQVGW